MQVCGTFNRVGANEFLAASARLLQEQAQAQAQVAVTDVLASIGTPVHVLTKSAPVDLINVAHGGAETVELVVSHRLATSGVEQHDPELSSALPATTAPQLQLDANISARASMSTSGGDNAPSPHTIPVAQEQAQAREQDQVRVVTQKLVPSSPKSKTRAAKPALRCAPPAQARVEKAKSAVGAGQTVAQDRRGELADDQLK